MTPEWVKNGVIYQIFPERFRNGNPANDPDFSEWYYQGRNQPPASGKLNPTSRSTTTSYRDWNALAALTQNPYTQDGRDWMVFYGGDIEGVRQKLDYLKDLGVTVIYFNPLFEAKSTHKYDAADYAKIDPHFGTNAEFIAFVKEAKAKGIRIVLDIVYNHCGNCALRVQGRGREGRRRAPTTTGSSSSAGRCPRAGPTWTSPWKPADYY